MVGINLTDIDGYERTQMSQIGCSFNRTFGVPEIHHLNGCSQAGISHLPDAPARASKPKTHRPQ